MTAPVPVPRPLPPGVTRLRITAARGEEPEPTTTEAISAWLLSGALAEPDIMRLFETFVWRLRAAGVPVDRASLHAGTLHPQLYGFAWNWSAASGICEEVQVAPEVLESAAFLKSPLRRVLESGERVRMRPQDQEATAYPLMAELAAGGFTEYEAFPLTTGRPYHNAMTAATRQPGGFTEAQLAPLPRILALFALHVERHIVKRIAQNVADAYLGPLAGGRVLAGHIRRGEGEAIRAIVWLSDLRGSTHLSETVAAPDVIALLNAYFERLADAVLAHGGEILKFLGDGLLAVFPFEANRNAEATARAALSAALDAQAAVAALGDAPPPALAGIDGWRPLRTVVALHAGDVFFGNVGAAARLDFTVIGPAVNGAARVEAIAKALDRPVVLTEPVARLVDAPLEALGEHALRGVDLPVRLYAPAAA